MKMNIEEGKIYVYLKGKIYHKNKETGEMEEVPEPKFQKRTIPDMLVIPNKPMSDHIKKKFKELMKSPHIHIALAKDSAF